MIVMPVTVCSRGLFGFCVCVNLCLSSAFWVQIPSKSIKEILTEKKIECEKKS